MRRFALIVVMLAACEKKAPRYEGPLRVELGDCAEDAVWVSGPRPTPPDERVAKKPDDKTVASNDPDEGGESGGAFASLTGTGDISSGFDDTNIYGGLVGNEVGEMNGGFGYSRSGSGPGGTGWGTIGTGRYGTIGRGSGTSGYGVGGGRGGMRGRSATVPTVSVGQPSAQGDLDKAIIRRYIKRNIQKIQYCYEKELLAKAGLSGTVQTQFFIGPDGLVKTASGSGMDANVASCVASVIKAIEFPKPKGGGGVQVNYPFTFRPAAGAAPAGSTEPPKPEPPTPEPPKPEAPKPDKPSIAAIAGKGGHYKPGLNNPLGSQMTALEECLRRNAKPYGVATVKLTWNGSAVATAQVQGISDDVAECVSEAAKKVSPVAGNTKPQTCSFAFGEMPIAELPGVDISATSLDFGGEKISTPAAVKDDPKAFKIDKLFERVEAAVNRDGATTAPVSIIGPLVIRAIDDTPIEVVSKTVSTIRAAGGDFVLAAKEPPTSWRLLQRDVVPPVAPVPLGTGRGWSVKRSRGRAVDEERVELSVLLTKDRIWVGLSRINEFQEVPKLASGEHDWDKLQAALEAHKKTAFFADRTDLEIAGEGVEYIDVVHTIDIAARAGFFDYLFSDPLGLAARPTL